MKILLTGLPGVGKTTLLQKIISDVGDAVWIICEEIRGRDGQRVGFAATTSTGISAVIAHKSDIASNVQIGSYKVDVQAIDKALTVPVKDFAQTNRLLILDEIGRMQMLSDHFVAAINDLFDSNKGFIATIRFGDEWTRQYTDRDDVLTVVLTEENREDAEAALKAMLDADPARLNLTASQLKSIHLLAKQYGASGELIQLKKLYRNAVRYIAEGRVKYRGTNQYEVEGDHASHGVLKRDGIWTCDCDLFNGRNQFRGKQGECSHIQAAKLLSVKPRLVSLC